MPYIIDWNTTLLQTYMGLNPNDISAALKILGNSAFIKARGNQFAPGLHHICFRDISYPNYGGIDFPCLIHNGNLNRDTIIIVGDAPRRNKYVVDKNRPCSLGSPYAIVFKEYPDQCWVYKQVFKTLCENYNLYLTDADKLWSKQNLLRKLPYDNDKILLDELKSIKHVRIVTFGSNAKSKVLKIQKKSTFFNNISHLYHPSQRNNNRWLQEKGVNGIDDIPDVIVKKILNNDDMFKH